MRGAMRRKSSASASGSPEPIRTTSSVSFRSRGIKLILSVTASRLVTHPSFREKEIAMIINTELSTSLQQAVDETRNRHIAAVNEGDSEAATNLFGPEAIFLPPGQPALEGLPAIRAWFTYVFTNF